MRRWPVGSTKYLRYRVLSRLPLKSSKDNFVISARSELIPNFISLFDLAQIEWEEFVEVDSAH